MTSKFDVGRVVATRSVISEVPQMEILTALRRHAAGDWGTVCAEDAGANDMAINDGTRILSSFDTPSGHKIWIITEADRSSTTVLFPHEY